VDRDTLKDSKFTLDFFAPRSLHQTKIINVIPAQTDDFVGLIYDQQEQLYINNLSIARADYIRMSKSLFLKRLQDVHEKCFHARAANFVRLYGSLEVPEPFYDLMSAMGRGYVAADGFHYYMTSVVMDHAAPANWWQIDNAILTSYVQMTRRMSSSYMHVEFPSSNDFDGRAIGATRVQTVGNLTEVLTKTPTPTPADGLLRMMNPEALFAGNVAPVVDCGFRICDNQFLASVQLDFVGSAVIDSNSLSLFFCI